MLHVIPIGDIEYHEEATTCECNPNVIIKDGVMICVHNAFDGRQIIEKFCDEVNKHIDKKNETSI